MQQNHIEGILPSEVVGLTRKNLARLASELIVN